MDSAKLSSRDQYVILRKGIAYRNCPFDAVVIRPLVRRGYFTRCDMIGHRPTYELTALGEKTAASLRARAAMENNHD